jgi:hypothetical protein
MAVSVPSQDNPAIRLSPTKSSLSATGALPLHQRIDCLGEDPDTAPHNDRIASAMAALGCDHHKRITEEPIIPK